MLRTLHVFGPEPDGQLCVIHLRLCGENETGRNGIGWHPFKRFRKTWLRGARCLEEINNC